jgi:tRNA-splicing ligase RtcB
VQQKWTKRKWTVSQRGILIAAGQWADWEGPDAYKNVSEVVEVSDKAGLAAKVAKLVPLVCIKG